MGFGLKVYHQLPSWLRGAAASMQGWRLDHLRYGPETAPWAAEARDREAWGAEQWQDWHGQRLPNLLRAASQHVPFYRDYWQREAGTAAVDDIHNWPILEKQSLRAQPERFVSDLTNRRALHCTHTSGSTGTPLKVHWSTETARRWYALFEARWRNWHGVSRHDRWAIIGGKQVIPPHAASPPYWVFNRGMHQLYMSAYHLSQHSAPAYAEALTKYRIRYVYSYTSGVYSLARFLAATSITPPKLEVIITNAEPLYSFQRKLIESVFRCPVRETYGMAEMVAGAGECEHGKLHLWPDAGYLELVSSNGEIKRSGTGQLIATGLLNPDMPLIRYRVGDTVTICDESTQCACGRRLPVLASVEGRNDDLLFTKDGREIGRLDPIFKSDYPILESQIIQKSLEFCEIRLVPLDGYTDLVGLAIASELKSRMGDIDVEVNLVDAIQRGANGKFKSVISNVTNRTSFIL